MKISNLDEVIRAINSYLYGSSSSPFFVVVDAESDYKAILSNFDSMYQMRVSGYCSGDSHPSYDELYTDVMKSEKDILLLGLGEAVSLLGDSMILARLSEMHPVSKVVILCRGIRGEINELCSHDRKLRSPHRLRVLQPGTAYTVISVAENVELSSTMGINAMLHKLESGSTEMLYVKTNHTLKNVKSIRSAYEAVVWLNPALTLEEHLVDDDEWACFLKDNSLEGYDILHFRTFLKVKLQPTNNVYVKYAVSKATDFRAYKKLLISALLDFDPNDNKYPAMYAARRDILKNLGDDVVFEYVANTKVKDSQRIFYLTDNTASERKAIFEALAGAETIPPEIETIYPALHEYLHDYSFDGTEIDNLLTTYFSEYKRQKVTNRIQPDFYQRVLDMAVDGERPYNKLKTRGFLLDQLRDETTLLYWIDSLGVEFLGFIQSRAKELGLKITMKAVQSNLPTITSQNKDFYESWSGSKRQTKALDRLKHEGENDYNYDDGSKLPIHIAEELQIIEEVLGDISSYLIQNKPAKVIVTSDHGASRLAVINEQENKWEMASKGKHSGRCCPCDEADVKSEFATKATAREGSKERDFWVLANYDRFKGGHKARVEVHGGASLEEVVVPVIEIELFDSSISISNTTPITTTSFKKNAELVLFSTSRLDNVSIRVRGNKAMYEAEPVGENKHKITLPDIKKAGQYKADFFKEHNLIGIIEFKVQRESGSTRDSDWF